MSKQDKVTMHMTYHWFLPIAPLAYFLLFMASP
jgi:hypothetical protein